MNEKEHSNQENCRNCGAPVEKNGDCPYCGTKRLPKSRIVITPSGISFTCE